MKREAYEVISGDLVEISSDEDIKEQVAYAFWLQIEQVRQELEVLMWNYRTQVAKEVYEQEEASHQLVEAWLETESNNVDTLERSLKYLLKRRQALISATAAEAEG